MILISVGRNPWLDFSVLSVKRSWKVKTDLYSLYFESRGLSTLVMGLSEAVTAKSKSKDNVYGI